MTLYRAMWESTVAAFADRQPYVDLKKRGGRPANATIMLDYKSEPVLWAFKLAFKNKHYILGLCMISFVLLTLVVVPVVAFLFTTASFASNTTIPVSITTAFTPGSIFPDVPDLRLSLDSAAAMVLQEARHPPWTDGEFTFPKFVPLDAGRDGNTTVEVTAYSAQTKCQNIPRSQYTKNVLPPGPPCTYRDSRIEVTANDRGCQIFATICITTNPEIPAIPLAQIFIKTASITMCSADSGWSRIMLITAKYIDSSTGITDFHLISCVPSYLMTLGLLTTTTSNSGESSPKNFAPFRTNSTKFRPGALWRLLEPNVLDFGCFDKLNNVVSDEFGRYVYRIAAKRFPESPLLPEAIIDGVQTLFSTTFAVLVSTEVYKPAIPPTNSTGIHTAEESRLIVVSPVAYIILSILSIVALLNLCLLFYARQESILLEEPIGLVSAAGILHNSAVNKMVLELVKNGNFDGKITEAMNRKDEFMTDRYMFDENERNIVRYNGAGTPRRSWWKSCMEWVKGSIRRSSQHEGDGRS